MGCQTAPETGLVEDEGGQVLVVGLGVGQHVLRDPLVEYLQHGLSSPGTATWIEPSTSQLWSHRSTKSIRRATSTLAMVGRMSRVDTSFSLGILAGTAGRWLWGGAGERREKLSQGHILWEDIEGSAGRGDKAGGLGVGINGHVGHKAVLPGDYQFQRKQESIRSTEGNEVQTGGLAQHVRSWDCQHAAD